MTYRMVYDLYKMIYVYCGIRIFLVINCLLSYMKSYVFFLPGDIVSDKLVNL